MDSHRVQAARRLHHRLQGIRHLLGRTGCGQLDDVTYLDKLGRVV